MKHYRTIAARQCSLRDDSLIDDQAGVTALEFAFVAPVFCLILSGIIELSLIMFVQNAMESATFTTSRTGSTGYVANGLTRVQEITQTVDAKTAGLLNPQILSITYEVYANLQQAALVSEPCITLKCGTGVAATDYQDINGNNKWDADLGTAGLGNAGDVVVYKVSYPWKVTTPLVSAILGSPFTITANAVVRNEPYSTGGR